MSKNVLITGGAGFIGANTAKRLIDAGYNVTIFDNLSRANTEKNLAWLNELYGGRFEFVKGDIRDCASVEAVSRNKDIVFHFAAQVAVTISVANPLEDFEINAKGSLNLLDALRKNSPNAIAIYSSTNKVYGALEDLDVELQDGHYEFVSTDYNKGISESRSADFHSPYGCSKGTADQYFRDFYRIYGLKTVVFRQSCIYGNRQFGNEDQGWAMHIFKKIYDGDVINIYGDGKQVRDLLYIDDLIDAYMLAIDKITVTAGQIYNIGGGSSNKLSLLEFIDKIQTSTGKSPSSINYSDWRAGDQKIFYSDNSKAEKDLTWQPKISVDEGIKRLGEWVKTI